MVWPPGAVDAATGGDPSSRFLFDCPGAGIEDSVEGPAEGLGSESI